MNKHKQNPLDLERALLLAWSAMHIMQLCFLVYVWTAINLVGRIIGILLIRCCVHDAAGGQVTLYIIGVT